MFRAARLTPVCLVLLLVLATPASSAEAPAAAPPAAQLQAAQKPIKALYKVILGCMKQSKSLGYKGRRSRMGPALEAAYDFDFMASKALGRYWRKLDAAQKDRWREAFTEMTVTTYATRFNGYSGEKLDIDSAEPSSRGTVVVRTQIVPTGDDPVSINYRMRSRNGQWKAIDVYLNGTVSELALRRSEYTTALKRDGFEKLVASLAEKAAHSGI